MIVPDVDTSAGLSEKIVSMGKVDPKQKNRVHYPEYWRRKKLSNEFVKELTDSANSEVKHTDQHGEYREGVFLHSYTLVRVKIIDGLWCCEIHSEKPVGLPAIREVRAKYLPDDMVFAMILPPRAAKMNNTLVSLYQIPGDLKDEK